MRTLPAGADLASSPLAPAPASARSAVALALLASAVLACEAAPPPECGGLCGPGTSCVDGKCVAAAPEAAPPPAEPTKKKTRGRRRGGGSNAAAAETGNVPTDGAPDEPLPPFVPVDDRKIPQFSSDHTQAIDLNAGNERPDEATLDRHFAKITPQIQDCVATASRYGEVGRGRLAVKLRIAGSGKVESVSVKAPASLDVWGIVPCARKAVYDHRFPAFDGPSVGVDFAVDID